VTRHEKMAARIAILHDLLHDPTVPITTLEILRGADPGTERDADGTVGLRLVRPLGDSGMPPPEATPGPEVDEAEIDPRFRARRVAVRRAANRRRLGRVSIVAGVLGAAGLAWGLTRTPLLDVDRVAVAGTQRTAVAEVAAAAGIPEGQALIDVDVGDVAARVGDLPWVASASVERHWPGTVVVVVQERRPVAVVALDEGEWGVLSGDGQLMEVAPEPPAGLVPLVDVPPVTEDGELEPATVEALAVARLLPSSLAGRVLGVGPGDGGGLELRLDPGGVVRLGPGRDIAAKLIAADAVLAEASSHCVDVIDVQVSDSPVLTLRPECG
jgi:cell division protein FtsQ